MSTPPEVVLPGPVRDRVVTIASDALGVLDPLEIPTRLRSIAKFAPAKRARLASGPLSTVLETDSAFAARVGELARAAEPDLCRELIAGRVPPAAEPVEVAALAYLLKAPRWPERVAAASAELGSRVAQDQAAGAELSRLREQLDAVRVQGRSALEAARRESEQLRSELGSMRRTVADARRAVAAAERSAQEAREAEVAGRAEADRRMASADAQERRTRERLAELEGLVETSRRSAKQGRSVEDVRLRLLIDTLLGAATGLRRELALPPVGQGERPADVVAGDVGAQAGASGVEAARARGLGHDDPAALDQLLALPQAHLVVDGYNVTKTGFGGIALDAQRARLITGLTAVAAQTAAEVTCVFDGAELDRQTPTGSTRAVRVVFSPPGVTADSVIRRLVREEPPGRPVIVVSSDREVIDGVVAAGARAVSSKALVRRLDRG